MRTERLLVRLDRETKLMLQQLAERQGTSLSDAVRLAIREVGWRRGLSATDGDLFTQRARRVLQGANDEAVARRATQITPIHLLLSLLCVRDGRAALILAALGVDVDRAYEAAYRLAGRNTGPPGNGYGLADAAKRVVERAVAESNRFEHHYVGTEHLLLGLLAGELDDPVARTFAALDVRPEAIRAAVELYKERLARALP